jgi:hypothetical protein
VQQVTTYALGRALRPEDETRLDQLTISFLQGGARFPALAQAIVHSELFRWRTRGKEIGSQARGTSAVGRQAGEHRFLERADTRGSP